MSCCCSSKILVAYFSHTGENYGVGNVSVGNTAKLAAEIAKQTGGVLFEIKPVKEYPHGDYNECCDVAKAELKANARPEIVADCPDFDSFSTIYLGYPIWWGDAPTPVYTFLEKHAGAFAGKTVVPFNTHEGSGTGSAPSHLRKACTGATVKSAFALAGHIAQKDAEGTAKAVRAFLGV